MTKNSFRLFKLACLFLGLLLLAPKLHAQFIFPQATSMSPLSVPANNPAFKLISQGVGFQSNGNAYAQGVPIEAGFHIDHLTDPRPFPIGQNGDIIGSLIVNGDAGTLTVNIPENFFAQASGTYIFTPDWCADSCFSPVTFQFTVTPSSQCASGLQPSSGALLFDPVPTLLQPDTGLITTDIVDLLDPGKGRPVIGVAADGVTQLVVCIPACKVGEHITMTILDDLQSPSTSITSNGGLSIPGLTGLTDYGSTVSISANGTDGHPMGIVTYRSPIDFARSNNTEVPKAPSRTIYLQAILDSLPNQPIIEPVTIVRPPVVLIHGLWSKAAVWSNFTSSLQRNYFDVTPFDYSTTNASGIALNANLLSNWLPDVVRVFGQLSNVASTQADVIAHSMGGLITRQFITLRRFVDNKNYNLGYIHKLITIDTPHEGTLLANSLSALPDPCHIFFFQIGKSIDEGAIQDLERGGPVVQRLNNATRAPKAIAGHTIVGIASPVQETLTENEWQLKAVSNGCRILPQNRFDLLFHEGSDLIVPISSQDISAIALGFNPFASRSFPGLIHSQDRILFKFGPDVLSSADILDHLLILLNSPTNSLNFAPISPTF